MRQRRQQSVLRRGDGTAALKGGHKIPVRIILPGGGIKAVFQLGFLKELVASNLFEIDKVYGCSAGCFMAAGAVSGHLDDLYEELKTINSLEDMTEPWSYAPAAMRSNLLSGLFSRLQQVVGLNVYVRKLLSIVYLFFNLGLYKRITLVDRLLKMLKPDEKRLVMKKVEVVAYDVLDHSSKWFTGPDVFAGIQASSAMWLIVPPVKHKDRWYSDGGALELYPLEKVDPSFPGLHIIVDLASSTWEPRKKLPSEIVSYMYDVLASLQINLAREKLDEVRKLLKKKLLIASPDTMLLKNTLDFNREAITRMYDAGRMKFHEFLRENMAVFSASKKKTD